MIRGRRHALGAKSDATSDHCKKMTGNHSPEKSGATPEPQAQPRIYGPFPAVVKGVDALGRRFKVKAALETLTATDFRLHLRRFVAVGERLCVAARIYQATVILRGTVSRAEPDGGEACGLEVSISRTRFLAPAGEQLFAAETAPVVPAAPLKPPTH